jgi:hypothetical protein
MRHFDFYNPTTHKGDLPVRVLPYNFLDWFETITPDFKEEAKGEIDFNGLKAGIAYHIDKSHITECACINGNRQIELYENFNQYLWCICYSLFVLFDESIQKPMLAGNYTGKFDFDNPYVRRAVDVFNNGFDLLTTYKDWQFFQLPNPEKCNEYDKFYIERTNGIFTAAMTFILLHKFAHQYHGHLEYDPTSEESKKDEYAADDYAIDKISYNFSSERGATFKFGIVAGICSLILLDKSLSGGETHPDTDNRLKVALEKIRLEELDNLWGVASLTFRLWASKYNIELDLPPIVDSYKHLFELTLEKVGEMKNNP